MEIFYGDNKFKKQLSNSTEIKKAYGINAKIIAIRLAQISAAFSLQVLMTVPGAKCHALTGDMKGSWAISVSGNDRLIFYITHDPIPLNPDKSINVSMVTKITLLRIQDYH